jgi:hypothetical protein
VPLNHSKSSLPTVSFELDLTLQPSSSSSKPKILSDQLGLSFSVGSPPKLSDYTDFYSTVSLNVINSY